MHLTRTTLITTGLCAFLIHFTVATNFTSHKWIGTIFSETLPSFTFSPGNDSCFEDFNLYYTHVNNGTLWAVQMRDSSASSFSGIISGNVFHMGNYDQCVSVRSPDLKVKGQYCLVKLRYWPKRQVFDGFYSNSSVFKEPLGFSSIWDKLKVTNDPRYLRRDILYIGLCVPSACSYQMVEKSLQEQYIEKFSSYGIGVQINVTENYCTTGEDQPFSLGFYLYIGFFGFVTTLVTLVTSIHIYNEVYDIQEVKWYYILSAVHNMRLMKRKGVSKEIAPSCGLKVISMFIIIFGHRQLLSLYSPLTNINHFEKKYDNFWEIYVLNGNIVVDTFFCTTGFITFKKVLEGLDSKKGFPMFRFIFYRWIRVTSVCQAVVLFMAYALPFTGSGALWKHESSERSQVCKTYWWLNLFYVNNYVHAEKLCLIPAWYLACDMQLFVITMLLGYILTKNKRMGYSALYLFLVMSVLIPGFLVFFKGYHGVFRLYIRSLKGFNLNEEYLNMYVKTHSRSAPYFVGMAAAHINSILMKNTVMLPFWLHVILLFSTILITGGCMLSAWPLYLPGQQFNWLPNALYVTLSKLFWATNMSWIIMANSTGGENLVALKFLSSKIFVILNKLTLCALLVHTPLQFILLMSSRAPTYLTHFTTVWMSLGDIALTYLISLIMYLILEAPVSGAMIQLMSNKLKGQS